MDKQRNMNPEVFGYYDKPEQTEPAYDPWLDARCPFCAKPLNEGELCAQAFFVPWDSKSYFRRYHRACLHRVGEVEHQRYLDAALDEIVKDMDENEVPVAELDIMSDGEVKIKQE